MKSQSRNILLEVLTGISLVGCFLNILTLVHDLYIFSNKDYLIEYLYLGWLSCTTIACIYGLLLLREANVEGFKFYFWGQVAELIFYIFIFIFVTIPGYKERLEMDNFLATAGFIKNAVPIVLMTALHYLNLKSITKYSKSLS